MAADGVPMSRWGGPARFRVAIGVCLAVGGSVLVMLAGADAAGWLKVLNDDCIDWDDGRAVDRPYNGEYDCSYTTWTTQSRADAWLTLVAFDGTLTALLAAVVLAVLRVARTLLWVATAGILVLLPVAGPPLAALVYPVAAPLLAATAVLVTLSRPRPA